MQNEGLEFSTFKGDGPHNENNIIKSSKKVTLCCLTWNMHGLEPKDEEIRQLLNPHKGFDIYAIGSEECLRSILLSLFYSSKSTWEQKLINYFGVDYMLVKSETLGAIHLIVIIKRTLMKELTSLSSHYVKTGAKNLLGNKGCVAICFKIYGITILIINSHLAAQHNRVNQRNLDYKRCIDKIYNLFNVVDFCIFMGDLNYRLQLNDIDIATIREKYKDLLQFDQLKIECFEKRLNLYGFIEGNIDFLPTFKYINNTDIFQYKSKIIVDDENDNIEEENEKEENNNYLEISRSKTVKTKNIKKFMSGVFNSINTKDNSDINKKNESKDKMPAWTDRILYKFQDQNRGIVITQERYSSMQNIIMSDHKPVYSYFSIVYT